MTNNKYVGPQPTNRLLTKEEIKNRFDAETALAYSQEDPVFLPDYATIFDLLITTIFESKSKYQRVLDLGAGTGNLSFRLLKKYPDCHVTLVDFSQNMLNVVPEVLKEFKDKYKTICSDFTEVSFDENSLDSVVSSFAIHHLRSQAEYSSLYKKVFNWLKPGGTFACLDVVNGYNKEWTSINENGWRMYLSKYYDAEKIDHILSNYHSEDTPISLPEHINCLYQAGFKDVDIMWKRFNFALYCAKK